MQTPRAQQAERTRRRILTTARRLFAERGYDATSLQDVADDMGVRKANVYYYFKTKGAILVELLTQVTAPMSDLLSEVESEPDVGERRRRLITGFVTESVRSFRESGPLNLGDPALAREPEAAAIMATLADRALTVMFGDRPTVDQRAAFWLAFDLAPVLRSMPDLTDAELRMALERLLNRVVAGL